LSLNFYRIPLINDWSFTPGVSISNSQTDYDSSYTNSQKRSLNVRSLGGRFGISNPRTFLGAFDLPISMSYKAVSDKYINISETKYQTLSANTGFSSSQTILQALNISEGIGYSQVVMFTEDTRTASVSYNFNLNSSTTLYRLFGIERFGIDNVLHRVTPSVGFSLTPQTKQYSIWGVPRLDTVPQSANLSFSVNNFFQGKLLKKDEKQDIATLVFQSNFDLKEKILSPLAVNSDIYLINKTNMHFTTNISLTYPWEKRPISKVRISALSFNNNFSYSFTRKDTIKKQEQGLNLSLNHFLTAYLDGYSQLSTQSNMLNAVINLSPVGWKFDFSTGYNFKEKRITDYSLSIWKDLHCWETIININRFGSEWAYDFKVRIKKIPDVAVGKGILGFVLPLE
jgi:hypothetical protein